MSKLDIAVGVLMTVGGGIALGVDARAGWGCVLAAGIVLVVARVWG